MKDEFELEIGPDGKITMIYQDGVEDFAEAIGAKLSRVCRLASVEWETIGDESGWSVRSAKDPEYCLRLIITQGMATWAPSYEGHVILFNTRDDALRAEAGTVWQLLRPPEKK